MKTCLKICLLLTGLASAPLAAAELTVSAASSLTESFREIAQAYERESGTRVNLNFAASGVLLQQIRRGAPVDVFASADEITMDQAVQGGLVDAGTRRTFASNTLWVVVPPQAGTPPSSLQALARPPVQRVAIGNPDSVPVGRYARGVLQAAGLWTALQAKMISTQNVRQSLDYVARGEVDAGFVYATDAQAAGMRVVHAFEVPVQGGINYPLALVKQGANTADAQRFIAFVRAPQGQAILRRHGFSSP